VHLGAALHDVGKLLYPDEMREPGHAHEQAGQALLIEHHVAEHVARFCITHASWDEPTLALEDLLVALADKLWKGKRVEKLEQLVVARLAYGLELPPWRVFELADTVFESVAEPASDRLARSMLST
jgi:hypothetical protein